MAKIEKVIKIETIKCDFCETTEENAFMSKCALCSKDICSAHTFEIKLPMVKEPLLCICGDCLAKLGLELKGDRIEE
jgi:hypothetical protein